MLNAGCWRGWKMTCFVIGIVIGTMNEVVPNQQNLIIYNTLDGKVSVAMMARDGNVWMNQKQMAELFATSKQNVGQHIANILKENELESNSVVKNFFITAADGKQYDVTFYSLDMVLAVGFRVKGKRGTQFRIWANQHLKEFIVKGFVLDDERLKNPDGRPDYFDELLERIRDIRVSTLPSTTGGRMWTICCNSKTRMCFAMLEASLTRKWKPMCWQFTNSSTNAVNKPMHNLPTKWMMRN